MRQNEEPRWGLPIPPVPEPTLLDQAITLLGDYQATIEELCEQSTMYTWLNSEKLTDLQKRLTEILKHRNEQLLGQEGNKE